MTRSTEFDREKGKIIGGIHRRAHRAVSDLEQDPWPQAAPWTIPEIRPTSDIGLSLLRDRIQQHHTIRRLLIQDFEKQFGNDMPLVLDALKIGDILAPSVNQIFLAQMEHASQPLPRSWIEDAPQHVAEFQEKVGEVLRDYPDYFQANPAAAEILKTLSRKVPYANDYEQFFELSKRLEALSIEGAKTGMPTIACTLTDYWTLPNDPTKIVHILEANIRFLVPYTGPEKARFDELVRFQDQIITNIFNQGTENVRQLEGDPYAIYGLTLGVSSGDQVWSINYAEAFSHFPGFYYSPQLLKSVPMIKKALEIANLTATDDEIIDIMAPFNAAHEECHQRNDLDNRLQEEHLADVPMLITNLAMFLRLIQQSDVPEMISAVDPQKAVAALVGEYICANFRALSESGDDEFDDGYILSARYLLYQLIKHDLVEVSIDGGSFSIPNDPQVLADRYSDLVEEEKTELSNILHNEPFINDRLRHPEIIFAPWEKQYHQLVTLFSEFAPIPLVPPRYAIDLITSSAGQPLPYVAPYIDRNENDSPSPPPIL